MLDFNIAIDFELGTACDIITLPMVQFVSRLPGVEQAGGILELSRFVKGNNRPHRTKSSVYGSGGHGQQSSSSVGVSPRHRGFAAWVTSARMYPTS